MARFPPSSVIEWIPRIGAATTKQYLDSIFQRKLNFKGFRILAVVFPYGQSKKASSNPFLSALNKV